MFSVLSFGLKNAPATFQRLLRTLFKDLGILPYIYDHVIISKTFGDHIQTIRNVLWKLRSANLKLNPSKCEFAEFSTVYLGLSVSAEGIRPNPDKIDKLKQMSVPKNKKELKHFCGVVGYLSKFIRKFADIMLHYFALTGIMFSSGLPPATTAFVKLLIISPTTFCCVIPIIPNRFFYGLRC